MKPATSSDSASSRSKGGRLVSASAETKNTTNIGSKRQPVPAEQAEGAVLRLDDLVQIERAGAEQHGDDDEADRDFVGDHLRCGAERGEEGVFGVRGPAGHDHAVDLQGRDGEDVEDADIDVGDGPAVGHRNDRPGGEREPAVTIGASRKMPLLAPAGMIGSLNTNFSRSAKDCSRPKGPTTFGPRRICTAAQTLRSA